jgi:hypothetical protein
VIPEYAKLLFRFLVIGRVKGELPPLQLLFVTPETLDSSRGRIRSLQSFILLLFIAFPSSHLCRRRVKRCSFEL